MVKSPVSQIRLWLLFALLVMPSAAASGEPHYATGVYAREADGRTHTLEIHVTHDGRLSGRSSNGGFYPFDGVFFEDGTGQGYLYTEQLISTSFHLEFDRDVIGFMTYPGSPGEVPEEGYEVRYYLRQPGPGPAEPFVMPMHVLMNRGDHDTVVRRTEHAELQLRDAINFLYLMDLAMKDAGFTSSMPRSGDWVNRAANAFMRAPAETQVRMAQSEEWWPQLQEDWPGADPEVRLEVALDVLLMGFTEPTIRDALEETGPQTGDTCGSYYGCLARVFDQERLDRARLRPPCLSLTGCEPATAPDRAQ